MTDMNTIAAGRLCQDVEDAAVQIRTLIGYRTEIGEILDRFWLLQDALNRLVDALDDDGGQASECRKLIRLVVAALESQGGRRATIPAVKNACDKINALLIRLERTTQQVRAAQ